MVYGSGKGNETKGVRDKGPKNHKSHKVEYTGDLMKVASTEVISTHSSNTVKNTAALMRDHDVRRLPVLRGGTDRLEGLATAVDILDFLGGGEKYNIIEKDYGGNFLAAVNCPISKIMREAQYLTKASSVSDAVDIMLDKKSSCIPIVDNAKDMNVVALVTERDLMPMNDPDGLGVQVKDVMHKEPITASLGMMLSDVAKIMVRSRLRRLPVISEGRLVGLVTVFDVLGFLEEGDYKGAGAEENLSTRVDEIMEENVTAVEPDEDLNKVIGLVRDSGYGGFPVVKDGQLRGIITTTDILRWIYRQK